MPPLTAPPFSPRLAALLASVCLVSMVGATPTATPDADPLALAWRDTSLGLFRDAHRAFAASDTREADLGRALTLLQLQPKTDANIRASAALLERIHATDTNDEIGVTALYFLGRLEHVHRTPPVPDAAAVHYRRLVAEHPTHSLAGQAVIKLAILELYRVPDASSFASATHTPSSATDSAAARARAFAEFSALAPRQPDAASLRDLHLALGEAALRFDLGDEPALRHFLAALDAGIALPSLRADTLVRTAELARLLGHADIARRHYDLFLAEFARDTRRLMITERLAALPAPASAKTAASASATHASVAP